MDFLSVKCEKYSKKQTVTKILRFYYKCVKSIDFLINKYKI